MEKLWIREFKNEIISRPISEKKYSKSGEYKLYKPFASWLIENDFCEHVTYWSRMIDTKFGTGSMPDLVGFRTNPFTVILVEVKDNARGRDQGTGLGQCVFYLGVAHEVWYVDHSSVLNSESSIHVQIAAERLGIGLCGWQGKGYNFESIKTPVRQDEPRLIDTWDIYSD